MTAESQIDSLRRRPSDLDSLIHQMSTAAQNDHPPDAEAASLQKEKVEMTSQTESASRTIYLVDQDAQFGEMAQQWLASHGYAVHHFADPHIVLETLKMLNAAVPSGLRDACLLLDMHTPPIKGRDLLERLTEDCITKTLPVVCMGERANVSMAKDALRRGAVDFLEKPFDETTLLNALGLAFPMVEPGKQNEGSNEKRSPASLADAVALLRAAETAATLEEVERRYDLLTPRERDVFTGMVNRKSAKEIARDLGIAYKTVEHHWCGVLRKMQVQTVKDLIPMVMNAS